MTGRAFEKVERLLGLSVLGWLALSAASCDSSMPPYSFPDPEPLCEHKAQRTINGYEEWGAAADTVTLDRDIFVSPTGTLRILPGTVVDMSRHVVRVCDPTGGYARSASIWVAGRLDCRGTPDSRITFITDGTFSWYSWLRVGYEGFWAIESIVEWTDVPALDWDYHPANVSHCTISVMSLTFCESAEIDSNAIGSLSVIEGKGRIRGNTFTLGLNVYGDSMLVAHNFFRDIHNENRGAITSGNDSGALITDNIFEGCTIAVMISGGRPAMHRNNFISNETNIGIFPERWAVETDTLDATDNWWGTTDTTVIRSKFEYWKNGETESHKVISFVPFALEPFHLAREARSR